MRSDKVWAAGELRTMVRITAHEIILSVRVIGAILLWVLGSSIIGPSLTAALVGIAPMLVCGIVTREDMAKEPLRLDDTGAARHAGDTGRWPVAPRLRQ